MSREDLIQLPGVVSDIKSGGLFSIKLGNGKEVLAKLSGRLRKFRISIIVGDKVTIGMSPYDLTHGLILSRERLNKPGFARPA